MGRHRDDESGVVGDRSLRRVRLAAVGASGLLVAGVAVGVAQTLPGADGTDGTLTVRSALSTAATTQPSTLAKTDTTTGPSTGTTGGALPTSSAKATTHRTHRSGTQTHHRRRPILPTWPGVPSSHPTAKPTTSPTSNPTTKPAPPSSSTPATTTTKPAAPATTGASSSFAQQVLSLTNAERAKAGCGALTANSTLTSVAQAHSADMAAHNYFSHNSQDGTSPFQRMTAAGYSYRTAGENIAAGQATPSAVVTAWMNSAGHRANILNCSFTQIGVGYATGGSYRTYWTQDFGTPR